MQFLLALAAGMGAYYAGSLTADVSFDADVGTSGPCLSCEEEELRKLQKTFAEEDTHLATLAQR